MLTGKRIRRRRIADVVDEIEFLRSHYGFEEYIVEDENFTFYRDHVIALSAELQRRGIKCYFSFPNGIRLDRLDGDVIHHLQRMGTYMVTVGIESGSQKTLRAIKKEWDLETVKVSVRMLRESGIIVHGAFILGFPGETMEDIKATIDFAIESGVDTAYFGNYIPLAGSEDFDRLLRSGELKLGEIDWDTYTSYYGRLPYHPEGVSEEDLLSAIRWGTARFYARPRTLLRLLRRMSRPVFLRSLLMRIKDLMRNDWRKGGESSRRREGVGKAVDAARISPKLAGLGRRGMLQRPSMASLWTDKGDRIPEVPVSTPKLIAKPSAD